MCRTLPVPRCAPMTNVVSLLVAGLLACLCELAVGAAASAADQDRAIEDTTKPTEQQREFFEKSVRPVLVANCYECHSHAAGKISGGLALDSRGGWAAGGDSGPAIVPGKPEKSLLILAVQKKGDIVMPPRKTLSEGDVNILIEWVRTGAADPRVLDAKVDPARWWSLQPLSRPDVPKTDAGGPHPIDAFIRHKLREQKLSPSPEADRRTLIRRLTFDLHGLPPTPEEVDAFVADRDPRAWEKLVDRLLASPRYGERWGRHWLDVVRYGDSRGNEHDGFREHAWRYRDYVIEAFNRDLPYGQFIQEQLAADALQPENGALTAALGFLAAGPDVLGGNDELNRDEYVTLTMTAFTSTTVHCARCHNHKFDPFTQEDYYAVAAALAGVKRRDVMIDFDPQVRQTRKKWTDLKGAVAKPAAAVLLNAENKQLVADWERLQQDRRPQWKVLVAESARATSGVLLEGRESGVVFVGQPAADADDYTLTFAAPGEKIRLLKLEALADTALPAGGPGHSPQGDFSLSEIVVNLYGPPKQVAKGDAAKGDTAKGGAAKGDPSADEKPQRVGIRSALANVVSKDNSPDRARDNQDKTGWLGGSPSSGKPFVAVFELNDLVSIPAGGRLEIVLKQQQGQKLTLGCFRISASDQPISPYTLEPATVSTAAAVPAPQRTDNHWLTLMSHALPLRCEDELARLPATTPHYVATGNLPHESPASPPRTINILKRGEKVVGSVGPGAIKAVSQLTARMDETAAASEPARRLWLARWLSEPANPLTWRSLANRVWHYHFGRGLVDSPSDLGHMGGLPSHPELLDWLACELRDGGQSLKKLHRLILTSETYRQAVTSHPAAEQIDRDNRLLWRMNRQRLDAESFRDAVLAVSGRLDLKMGGPGVMQFEVKNGFNTTKLANYDNFDWNADGAGRRSVYRFIFRTRPDPFMSALDFPDASQFVPARPSSVSPLQALVLLNNRFILQHSERLAERVARQTADPAVQVRDAFRITLGREPAAEEQTEFTTYLTRHGLPAMCRLLLNCNEFLFVD